MKMNLKPLKFAFYLATSALIGESISYASDSKENEGPRYLQIIIGEREIDRKTGIEFIGCKYKNETSFPINRNVKTNDLTGRFKVELIDKESKTLLENNTALITNREKGIRKALHVFTFENISLSQAESVRITYPDQNTTNTYKIKEKLLK
jgi:hypothetical protein